MGEPSPTGPRGGHRKSPALVEGPAASRFVRQIDGLIAASGKTQRQIALELGYANPNIVTMFKQGKTRVPAGRVAPLALALGADPAELLRLWLAEHEPQMLTAIERHLGVILSPRERERVEALRRSFPAGHLPRDEVAQPGSAAA